MPENSLLLHSQSLEFEGHMTKIEMHENILEVLLLLLLRVYQNRMP